LLIRHIISIYMVQNVELYLLIHKFKGIKNELIINTFSVTETRILCSVQLKWNKILKTLC